MAKRRPLPRSLKMKAFAAGAGGAPMGFTMQQQQQTQWCWAAVSTSVNLFYHPASGQTQCAVANVAMNQTTCCQDGGSAQCNQPWFLDQALQIVGNLNAWSPGKAPFLTVRAEIIAGHPFCLRIAWNGGGGHFVAVREFRSSPQQRIGIADPWYGDSVVPYATFPSTYQGGGTWTDNYTTKS